METTSATEKARTRRDDEGRGKAYDGRHLVIAGYTPEQERKIMAMQVWIGSKQPLQRADGTFPFMIGYDTLGSATL